MNDAPEQQRAMPVTRRARQRGIALVAMLTLLTVLGVYLLVGQLSATEYRQARARDEASALAQAKQALIGDAIGRSSLTDAGFLRLPDLGPTDFSSYSEGNSSGNFSGNSQDLTVIGRYPWQTLATTPLRDRDAQCLWYAVSGRFKNSVKTAVFNWDTQGQIDVIDADGTTLASNLAALLIAAGPALDGQERTQDDSSSVQCGGNYDARNYLDAYDAANAVAGEVNYFATSTNHRVATSSDNKRFVLADNAHYNDRLLYVTVDDIFKPLMRRSDFATAITALLKLTDLATVEIAGSKGTDKLTCSASDTFCTNWKEMLFLTDLQTPAPIIIDGKASTGNCSRVALFSGSRNSLQYRSTAAQKADKTNYLEGSNATAFDTPTANSSDFSGASAFNWKTPQADIIRCVK